jgi:pimeloyl-ACP methyl ester carboxylesterase
LISYKLEEIQVDSTTSEEIVDPFEQIGEMKRLNIVGGLKIGYKEWGIPSADVSKRIIALHGWLDNANSFNILGPYFANKGYHMIAIDHLGHGHSDHLGKGGHYTMQKSVGVVRDILQILNWETSHIIGHSMGASISVMYAATFPEKVDKLVLIEGFGPLTAKVENTVRNLRKALDGERLMFLKNKLPKLYPTMLQAIQARMEVVKTYPGQQFISKEAAISLVSR